MTTEAPSSDTREPGNVTFRRPRLSDGANIHRLISECPPLDLNSPYLYNLLCTHHAETCVVAESGDALCGYTSAYRLPEDPAILFVWQVAVAPSARGVGLAARMIESLLARESLRGILAIETTVSPSNTASNRTFESIARRLGVSITRRPFMVETDFPPATSHEAEPILRIAPITNHPPP